MAVVHLAVTSGMISGNELPGIRKFFRDPGTRVPINIPNTYPGVHKQNQTEMFSDYDDIDETSSHFAICHIVGLRMKWL